MAIQISGTNVIDNNRYINAGISTFSGQIQSTQANSTTTGGGQIYLNGATGNRIDFNTNGVAAPAFTTRSAGTKLVLYPSIGASSSDYGFGIENSTLWYSVPSTSETHRWYGGTTSMMTLSNGNLSFNSGFGSVAVAYGCRAWVNFNGTGTIAIRKSGNVTSLTDSAVGEYFVNLTTAMTDTSCAVLGGAGNNSVETLYTAMTTTSQFYISTYDAVANVYVDSTIVAAGVFR